MGDVGVERPGVEDPAGHRDVADREDQQNRRDDEVAQWDAGVASDGEPGGGATSDHRQRRGGGQHGEDHGEYAQAASAQGP